MLKLRRTDYRRVRAMTSVRARLIVPLFPAASMAPAVAVTLKRRSARADAALRLETLTFTVPDLPGPKLNGAVPSASTRLRVPTFLLLASFSVPAHGSVSTVAHDRVSGITFFADSLRAPAPMANEGAVRSTVGTAGESGGPGGPAGTAVTSTAALRTAARPVGSDA